MAFIYFYNAPENTTLQPFNETGTLVVVWPFYESLTLCTAIFFVAFSPPST